MKSKICRQRATSWCGRTSRSATRIKVRVDLSSTYWKYLVVV
jgi:hypothetical protein